MKAVVIYKSNTGFTKKYAEWVSEELSAHIFDVSAVSVDDLSAYDTIIFGGSLHAVGITGVNFIKRNLDRLKDKKIVVFATGASPSRKEAIDEVRDKNFTEEQQKYIKFFYLRGGFDYSRLKPYDKFLMTLLKLKLKRKKKLLPDEKGMLASYSRPVDFTSRKNIDELIAYVNS